MYKVSRCNGVYGLLPNHIMSIQTSVFNLKLDTDHLTDPPRETEMEKSCPLSSKELSSADRNTQTITFKREYQRAK